MPFRFALVLAILYAADARAAAPEGPARERAIALPLWESLTSRFQTNLTQLAGELRRRDRAAVLRWFSASFHGEVALGGETKGDQPALFVERITWKRALKGKPALVDGAASIAPLFDVLTPWKSVDHAAFTVPQALFYDRDGHNGASRVDLSLSGRDATGRPASMQLTWDLCLRGEGNRFSIDCLTMRTAELMTAAKPLFEESTVAKVVDRATTGFALAAGDADGDGITDLFADGRGILLARADRFEPAGPRVAGATAALWADLDNDGDQDLVLGLPAAPGIALYENVDGAFVERAARSGATCASAVTALACADFDGDGSPDLFAARDRAPGLLLLQAGPLAFRARDLGAACSARAAAAADADADGDQDLFVACDSGPDSFFENDGSAAFTERAAALGVADGGRGSGAAFGDWDGDGALDLWIGGAGSADAERMLGRLYGARPAAGPGADIAALSDSDALYLRRRGSYADWRRRVRLGGAVAGGFLDVDNDGRLDLFTAGGSSDSAALWLSVLIGTPRPPASATPARDHLYWNAGKAAALDISALSGAPAAGDHRALAVLDFDRDGDADVALTSPRGLRLLRNTSDANASWLRLVLVGTESNRDGIGARVRVRAGGRTIVRALQPADAGGLTIGLEAAAMAETVDVFWPSGVSEHYGPLPARTAQRLVEGEGELGPAKAGPRPSMTGIAAPKAPIGSPSGSGRPKKH